MASISSSGESFFSSLRARFTSAFAVFFSVFSFPLPGFFVFFPIFFFFFFFLSLTRRSEHLPLPPPPPPPPKNDVFALALLLLSFINLI
jgi:hypothetical protein